MFAWLRGMTKWILMNRNRRIVTIIAFLNVLLGYLVFALFHEPRLIILMALVSAYAVSSLTMERYLTLGASCIAALQILLFLLLEPALVAAPLTNAPLLLLITAALTLLMMSMITNIQQQEYFSTIESDRQLLYKATINALLSARGLPSIYSTVLSAVSELYGRSSVLFSRNAERSFPPAACRRGSLSTIPNLRLQRPCSHPESLPGAFWSPARFLRFSTFRSNPAARCSQCLPFCSPMGNR